MRIRIRKSSCDFDRPSPAIFWRRCGTIARTINPHTLVTCNNSLNSPGVLYSQCRTYGYNIFEMSKAEDYVVVEDMADAAADGSERTGF